MPECDRCGKYATSSYRGTDTAYCEECRDTFQAIREEGVTVSRVPDNPNVPPRHQNFEGQPFVIEDPEGEQTIEEDVGDALARAVEASDEDDCRALFVDQIEGKAWILDEYLEEHREARAAVQERRGGFLQTLKDSLGL